MSRLHFPAMLRKLPEYEGRFEAYSLAAENCEVLFASYPPGTEIEPHTHPTRNAGVITEGELILLKDGKEQRYGVGEWYTLEPNEEHAARFEVDTSEIEFWFDA